MLRIFSFLPPPNLPSGEALSLRSERAASCSCLLISDNGKQIHGIKLQSPHYQYVLFSTCSFRTLRGVRKALVTFVSSYLSAFYKKQVLQHLPLPLRGCFVLQHLPLPLRGCFSPFEVNLESETHVHQRTGIRSSEHGAVILPRGTAVVECHTCVQADHVVLEEGVLIAQARVARQAGDMVLPGGGGVVFGLA